MVSRSNGAILARVPRIAARFDEIELSFETSAGLFSPGAVDRGTRALLAQVDLSPDDRVLDLGCGYGVIGILVARRIGAERVVMLDSDPEAIRLARHNAVLNAVEGVTIERSEALRDTRETDFTWILCNPPYHTDFAVPREMIEKGFNRLRVGGRMALVTRRRTWYEKKLGGIFGGAEVHEVDGYFVLTAEKRRKDYARRRR